MAKERETLKIQTNAALYWLLIAAAYAVGALVLKWAFEGASSPESGMRFWAEMATTSSYVVLGIATTYAIWTLGKAVVFSQKSEREFLRDPNWDMNLYKVETPGEDDQTQSAPSPEIAVFLACQGNPTKRGMRVTALGPDKTSGLELKSTLETYLRNHKTIADAIDKREPMSSVLEVAGRRMEGFWRSK